MSQLLRIPAVPAGQMGFLGVDEERVVRPSEAFNLRSQQVQGWFADVTSFPREWRGKCVYTSSSFRCGNVRMRAYLVLKNGRVEVCWFVEAPVAIGAPAEQAS